MTGGRPLWFLVMVLGGWTALRAAMLWPEVAAVTEKVQAMAAQVSAQVSAQLSEPGVVAAAALAPATGLVGIATRLVEPVPQPPVTPMAPRRVAAGGAVAIRVQAGAPQPASVTDEPDGARRMLQPPPLAPTPIARGGGRLAGTA